MRRGAPEKMKGVDAMTNKEVIPTLLPQPRDQRLEGTDRGNGKPRRVHHAQFNGDAARFGHIGQDRFGGGTDRHACAVG